MKTENQYILELCKFLNPDKEMIVKLMEKPLDYPYILGHVLFNRMGSVAFYVLNKCELLNKVNREFRNTLTSIYENDKEKTDSFITMLNYLSGLLNNSNFSYAILKGGFLNSHYPKGLRTSNDIDILIDEKDITKLADILKQNGFKQGYIRNNLFISATRSEIISSRINRGETVPFIKNIDLPKMQYCEIDINYSLDYKAIQETNVISEFLKNKEKLNNSLLYTLSLSDFFIQLCVHLFKEATVFNWVMMSRDLSLYKFCDLYYLINEFFNEELCEKIEKRINEFNLNNECYYALFYTNCLFNIKNLYFIKLLRLIKPKNTKYLSYVIDPSDNKTYQYKQSFINRFFNGKRKDMLYAINDEK